MKHRNELKDKLAARQMTVADLARKLNVHKSTALRWTLNRVPIERVAGISQATGIPYGELRPDVFGAREAAE